MKVRSVFFPEPLKPSMNENGKNGEIPPPLPRENNENSENIPLLRHAPLPECFHSGKGGGALDISAEVF